MNHTLHHSRSLLWLLSGIFCLGSQAAFAQNVIRGTTPGWPGNTAYYAPQNVYQLASNGVTPVMQTQYAPRPGQTTSYYAPAAATRIAYAVPAAGSYQVTYAGANQAGLATTAYYGGFSPPPPRVAYYAPQQVYYQPAVAPVQYYRPVIAYQPGVVAPAPAVAVVPQTCGYSSCQTSSCGSGCGSSCWSPWRPFAWLWGGSCNKSSCCKPPCGAPAVPYYTTPVIPTAPAPATVIPSSPFRNPTVTPGVLGGTVPPPATRSPGTIITTPPASTVPRIDPGTVIPANPGTVPPPTFNNPNFGPPPPVVPGAPIDPNRFRPTFTDPYSQSAPATSDAPVMLQPPPASSPINPSGFRSTSDRANVQLPLQGPSTITEPGLSVPPSSVQPLRDPHGDDRNRNRAPQLLTPGDRTAKADQRWAVVPAVWPVKANEVQPVVQSKPELAPVAPQTQLDDGGWKSAR